MHISQISILSSLLATALAIPAPNLAPTPVLLPRQITAAQSTSTPEAAPLVSYFTTTEQITIAGVTNAQVTLPAKTINIAIPTCIQTITPDKNGYVPPGTCGALYDYYPSFAAAVAAAVIFGILTVAHVVQAAWWKKSFCWVLIMGSLWETLSFSIRSIATHSQQSIGLELVSSLFVLIAPLWVNAFAYMVLGRMIYFFVPSRSLFSIPASTLALVFVSLDFVSFVIQIVGGSYAGPSAPVDQQMKGVHIYMGGIGLQQFFIFVFLALTVKFHLTMNAASYAKPGWKRLLITLYVSLTCISFRIFFRLVEFSAGKTASNPLPFHESYFYALEALPMSVAIGVWNLMHPGGILVGKEAELPGLRETLCPGCCKGRGRKAKLGRISAGEDGEELVSEYVRLDGKEQSPPRYSEGFR